jgi:hypothetical protein
VAHLDVVKEYEAAKKAAQTAVVLGPPNANGANMHVHGMDIVCFCHYISFKYQQINF